MLINRDHPQYDVVIVGGGPSGALAGLTLMQKGYRVALLDKCRFPRDKACGGGLSLRAVRRFPVLARALAAISTHDVHRVCLRSPDGTVVTEDRAAPLYVMIRRYELDAQLVAQCQQGGVHILEEHTVKHLAYQPDFVEVLTNRGRLTAKIVIGADGVHSVIAKATGLNPGWRPEQLAIDFMEETAYDHLTLDARDAMQVFYGFNYSAGYGYIFPKKTHVNIGIGFLYAYFREQMHAKPYQIYTNFLEFLAQQQLIKGTTQRRNFRGHFVPVGGPLPKTFAERVLLCGDAAGFVNAFSAEGIYYAMVSGAHAAYAALAALAQNSFSAQALAAYQTSWQREIGAELTVAVKIQKELFHRPQAVNLIVNAAQKNARLREALTSYVIGELDYRGLKKRLFCSFTPFYLTYQLGKLFRGSEKNH